MPAAPDTQANAANLQTGIIAWAAKCNLFIGLQLERHEVSVTSACRAG